MMMFLYGTPCSDLSDLQCSRLLVKMKNDKGSKASERKRQKRRKRERDLLTKRKKDWERERGLEDTKDAESQK